jgi:hypothetical protein
MIIMVMEIVIVFVMVVIAIAYEAPAELRQRPGEDHQQNEKACAFKELNHIGSRFIVIAQSDYD